MAKAPQANQTDNNPRKAQHRKNPTEAPQAKPLSPNGLNPKI
jgi:hypothetical protein